MYGSSNFKNANEHDRHFAILDYCERAIRGQLPDLDDVQTDGPFLRDAMFNQGRKTQYLIARAAAKTTAEFYKTVNAADSMRVVRIDPESKQAKRLKEFKCDACGRKEKNCAFAIDLCGKNNDPKFWCKEVEHLDDEFTEFVDEYNDRFKCDMQDADKHKKLYDFDVGRFYVGNTCMRKAVLQFICSTFVQDVMYSMYHRFLGASKIELEKPELLWCGEEEVDKLQTFISEIEMCIADEKRPIPDLCVDESFWRLVDKRRDACASYDACEVDILLKKRSKESLHENKLDEEKEAKDTDVESQDEDEEDDPPIPRFPSDCDDAEEEGGYDKHAGCNLVESDEDGEDEVQVAGSSRMHARKNRSIVIEESDASDDESGEEEDGDDEQGSSSKKKRGKQPIRRVSHSKTYPTSRIQVRRSSRKRSSPDYLVNQGKKKTRKKTPSPVLEEEGEEEDDVEDEEEEEEDEGEEVQCDHPLPSLPSLPSLPPLQGFSGSSAETQLVAAPRLPPPSARSIATSMRIPSADGAPGPLGSRNAALLGLMDVQALLTREARHADASKLTRAILTFQELLEISSRA